MNANTKVEPEITRGVAIPDQRPLADRLPIGTTYVYPWSKMQPGDSFFLPVEPGVDIIRTMNRATASGFRHFGPGRVSARKVIESGRMGTRVWLLDAEAAE